MIIRRLLLATKVLNVVLITIYDDISLFDIQLVASLVSTSYSHNYSFALRKILNTFGFDNLVIRSVCC
jgi:hypothetical protein